MKNLKINEAVDYLDDEFKTIKVSYVKDFIGTGAQLYTYKWPKCLALPSVGDLVLVPNTNDPGHFKCTFFASEDSDPDLEYAGRLVWAVGAVSLEVYHAVQEREEKIRAVVVGQMKKQRRAEVNAYLSEALGIDDSLSLPSLVIDDDC